MPTTITSTPGDRDRLLDLAAETLVKSTSSPNFPRARQDCENVLGAFMEACEEAEKSPGVAESRKMLGDLVKSADNLAEKFRKIVDMDAHIFGAATDNPEDSDEARLSKKQEIEEWRRRALDDAATLDQMADRWRGRRNQWEGKNTGPQKAYGMSFGRPVQQLARNTVRLVQKYGSRKNMQIDHVIEIMEPLYKAATGRETYSVAVEKESKEAGLRHSIQDAIEALSRDR